MGAHGLSFKGLHEEGLLEAGAEGRLFFGLVVDLKLAMATRSPAKADHRSRYALSIDSLLTPGTLVRGVSFIPTNLQRQITTIIL